LNFSSFYKLKLKSTSFRDCQLQDVEFAEGDFTKAVFHNCDLSKANFEHTTLESADFRTAYNYSVNPEINRVKKAKFSLDGIAGLLDKYEIVVE
jgi:uncharacterized protein YjbI with pentapeptide repeats